VVLEVINENIVWSFENLVIYLKYGLQKIIIVIKTVCANIIENVIWLDNDLMNGLPLCICTLILYFN
jgi:hypothetical protein